MENAATRLGNLAGGIAKKETLQDRLKMTVQVLDNCEGIMSLIANKVFGPTPEGRNEKSVDVQGINSLAMEIHSRTIRLRDSLEAMNQELA